MASDSDGGGQERQLWALALRNPVCVVEQQAGSSIAFEDGSWAGEG